ncbi:hypothetical protein K0M31_011240 [Melipona bicolor]|uniref:Uncharacterized protein n=1 Tax=Melipona bicolor TaxID=60889 RepID=A0AA40KUU2_9HYME|nr:hypothetical protein K0M31_011240 [Melipona bicolor]
MIIRQFVFNRDYEVIGDKIPDDKITDDKIRGTVLSNYDDLRHFAHRNVLFGTQSPSKSAKISIDFLVDAEKTFKHAPSLRTDWLTLKYAVCHGIGEVARNTNVNPKTTGRKKARMPDWQEEILFQ